MGAHHSHDQAIPASRTAVRVTLCFIIPLAIATLAALLWMWPSAPAQPDGPDAGVTRLKGQIVAVTEQPCPSEEPVAEEAKCIDATVTLHSGLPGRIVTATVPSGPGSPKFAADDEVFVLRLQPDSGAATYQVSDHDRGTALWIVGMAFILAVIAFGRWRGLAALAGLAITFVLLLKFLIPAILNGEPPLLAAIVCAAAIMFAVLYLTHGFTTTTSMAVAGTLLSLALTGALAALGISLAHLTGITDDSSLYLDLNYEVNTKGLLLASVIIGSLGVLDDVTVTQSVTVTELSRANPSYTFGQLYKAAARVGRAHIASVINTIILAYSGAALPLLLLFSIGNQPLSEIITSPIIAQEIVRAVVGTLGLIAAVPLTTALATAACARRKSGPATVDDSPALEDAW